MKLLNKLFFENKRKSISQTLKKIHKEKRNLIEKTKIHFKCPFTISDWYGRTGNNIQQIAIGIISSKLNGERFISPNHKLIKKIYFNFPNYLLISPKRKNRFYSFIGSEEIPDVQIEYEFLKNHIHETIQKYVRPSLKIKNLEPLNDDYLVIHLRGGDIFVPDQTHCDYIQNPLSFYHELIPKFKKTLIVSEPGNRNPILEILKTNYPVTIQSSSVAEDFATLMRATNLATSGVGTFAIAAAMCSSNLKNFYCSDQYLTEHLNPEMLRGDISVHITSLPEYIKLGEWDLSEQMMEKLLRYQIKK